MTKEEVLKVIRHMAYLSAHVVENGIEAYEYIEQLLSQPSLPSNINEAAEEEYPDFSNSIASKAAVDSMREAFKAGAKWMAEQGVTCNGEIEMDFSDPDDIYARRLSADYWNELGPALMKVEPGDVLIQIRKKQ